MSWPLSQDYNEAIQDPRNNFSDAELKTGEAVTNALGIPMPRSGNFADVYEVCCPSGARWAVKCFTREVHGLRERYTEISKYLRSANLPFMVDFQYLEQGIRVRGQWYPVLKMQWVEGFVLNEFVRDNLDKKPILQALGQIWLRMARRLSETKLAHGDLQHGNVLFVPGSTANSLAVKLIDYDGMCVPALARKKSGEVGHPAYQHPERLRTGAYKPKMDRFSLLSIATALRCLALGGRSLWERYDNGDNLLFRQADLQAPSESPLFQELLAIGDPQTQKLVTELHRACQGPLDAVPLLTDLLPEEKPAGKVTKTVAVSSSAVTQQMAGLQGPDWDFGDGESGTPVVKKQRASGGIPLWAWGAMGGAATLLLSIGVAVGLFLHKAPAEKEDTPVARTKPETKPVKQAPKPRADESAQTPAAEVHPIIPGNDGNKPPAPQPAPEQPLPRRIFQLNPAGNMLAISDEGDKTWRLVNPHTNERIREFKGHEDAISAVAFSANGSRVLTGGHDKQMIVWDATTGDIIRSIRSASAPLVSVALSPDGKKAAGTDITRTITVWDVESGRPVNNYGHPGNVRSVAFSPDGQHLLCGLDKSDKPNDVVMLIWSLPPNISARSFRSSGVAVAALAASADGNYIATVHPGVMPMVSLWDARTSRLLWRMPALSGSIHQLAFSPDSRFFVAAAGNRYQVWHTGPTPQPVTSGASGGQELVTTIFTPDSKGVTFAYRKGGLATLFREVRLPGTAVAANPPPAPTLPESGKVLTPIQAASRAGQKVTVQLRVQGGGGNGEFVELYSEPAWDREGNMFIRFPESARKKFQKIGIPHVGRHFSHKLIRVSGTVTILRFDARTFPCIVIDDPDQIKELPATADVAVKPPQRPRPRRSSNKMAVPDEATLADKQKQLRVMYRDDYKGMPKRGLASRLYDDSMRQGDLGMRYVMLNEACDLASQDGDLLTALRAASEIGSYFDVDSLEAKCRVLEQTLRALPPRDKNAYRLLTQKALLFLDRAIIEEKFDRGDRLLEVAKAAAAKADPLLVKMVAKEAKQFKTLHEEYDAVKRFVDKLETDPDDADANLALGRFRCVVRGDWDAGLPLLVKGSDKALSELAQKDLADPAAPAARAALGDAWANRADKVIGAEQEACRRRAYYWYHDCLDNLEKKERARVNTRLTKLTAQMPELKRPFQDLDTGNAVTTRNAGALLLHLPPQHRIATRQLYRGPIDIRVSVLMPKNYIRITFLNGGELVLHPENRVTKARFYTPYVNDPDSQGSGPNTYFVTLQPGFQQIRILVTADSWSFWVNDKLVGSHSGFRFVSYAPSPVRVWSDDGEIDVKALVVKRVR